MSPAFPVLSLNWATEFGTITVEDIAKIIRRGPLGMGWCLGLVKGW